VFGDQLGGITEMAEKLAGVVRACTVQLPSQNGLSGGLLLRPEREWDSQLVVRSAVRLELPGGRSLHTKIKGGELWRYLPDGSPAAILVELQPDVENEIPAGTLVYIDEVP
jgi:hypothetical protein